MSLLLLLLLVAARWLGVCCCLAGGFFLTRHSMRTSNVCARAPPSDDVGAFRPPSNLVRDNVCRQCKPVWLTWFVTHRIVGIHGDSTRW